MDTEGKKKCDEATMRRLANARLKGLETRRMKAELKKADKEAEKKKLKDAYDEKVLKKTPQKKAEEVTEETEEMYHNQPTAESESEEDFDDEPPKPKATQKPKAVTKKPSTKATNSYDEVPTNYKQEYYKMKMMKLQQQEQQSQYMQTYSQASPQTHMIDIAKSQLQSKVNKELMSRVYSDLFNC
jgi:hypothetical protein